MLILKIAKFNRTNLFGFSASDYRKLKRLLSLNYNQLNDRFLWNGSL